MKRRAWLWLLPLLLVLGWLATQFKPYEENVRLGPQGEARSNPYLAAERFLRREGRTLDSQPAPVDLENLPSHGQTLILLGDRSQMSARRADQLLAWAEQGGHLIFIAERLYDETSGRSGDLLLDRLGIQQLMSDSLEPLEEDDLPWPQLTRLYLENEPSPAYIGFDPQFHLYDAQNLAHAWANSAQATHLLQLRQGEGLITVLTDPWIWQNAHIGEYDNAWLLWYLTQKTHVIFSRDGAQPGLAEWLWAHFPEALVALGALILAALWHLGSRHGPLLPAPPGQAGQLRERLTAGAAFLRRRAGNRQLLSALQREIEQRAARQHPGYAQLPVAERWRLLGQRCGLSPQRIARAMRPLPDPPPPGAAFIRHVQELQIIRNAL